MATLRKISRVWYSDIRVAGRRIVKALSTDRRIAEEKLADLIKQRDAYRHGHAPRDTSWLEFKNRYLDYSRGAKSKFTYFRDKASIVALERLFPITRLSQITPELLEQFKAERHQSNIGHTTINRDLCSIKAMLHRAVDWGYLVPQKWGSVKDFKVTRGRLLFYTANELQRMLGYMKGVWLTACLLGARAGLRRSEMYYLAWGDIDWDRNQLHVCAKEGWDPKDYEQRWIPLEKVLRSHLWARREAIGWVLEDKEGYRPSLSVLSAYFAKIVRKAGLRGGLHTLRHTFASHLAMAGVPLYTISKLLGHSSVQTTEIYSHLHPSTMDEAVKRLPSL